MKPALSVWSSFFYELAPQDALAHLMRHGIYASEFSGEHAQMLLDSDDALRAGRELAEFAREHGFSLTQGHLWHDCDFCTYESHFEKLLEWVDLFEAMGIENGVLHPDALSRFPELSAQERTERNVHMLSLLDEYMSGRGMKMRICLENLKSFWTDIDSINGLIDRLDTARFGICLDTSHLHLCRGDQRDFILRAGDRLHALHVGDNDGSADQHLMPYTSGKIDFRAVWAALCEVEYDGLFNLEIPGENRVPHALRELKLPYIKQCYEYISK